MRTLKLAIVVLKLVVVVSKLVMVILKFVIIVLKLAKVAPSRTRLLLHGRSSITMEREI